MILFRGIIVPSDLWEQLGHKYIRNDRGLQGSHKVP